MGKLGHFVYVLSWGGSGGRIVEKMVRKAESLTSRQHGWLLETTIRPLL